MMSKKRTILIEATLVVAVLTTGIAAAQAAFAAPLSGAMQGAVDPRANVKIESEILVERTEEDASGNPQVKFHKPTEVKVVPGDKLVFINSYRNSGATAVTGFVVNNPVHSAVSFTGVSENWAVVSVDGGKTFGKLTDLSVKDTVADGAAVEGTTRPAQPADVTHIRWAFAKPIPGGASGKLRFRGTVK